MSRSGITKNCNTCFKDLSLDSFHKDSRNRTDGRQRMCKSCKKVYSDSRKDIKRVYDAKYRDANQDRLKAIKKKYRSTEKYKKMHAISNKRYRKNNPEKYRAHGKVNSLKQQGRIKEMPCKCGSKNVHAHHHDYSKPLDIEWLCPTCHKRLHRTVNV